MTSASSPGSVATSRTRSHSIETRYACVGALGNRQAQATSLIAIGRER